MGRIQSCLALYLIREPGTWWLSLPSAGCWKTRPGLAPPTPLVMDHSKSQVSFRATHRHQTFGKQPWRPVGRHGALGGSHGHDPCRPHRPGRTLVATVGGRVPADLWDHTGGCSCYVCAPGLGGCWRLGRDAGMPCSCSSSPMQLSRVHRNSVSMQVQSLGRVPM